jgi:hypothetical protein
MGHRCKICQAPEETRLAVEAELDSGVPLKILQVKLGFSRSMLSKHYIFVRAERRRTALYHSQPGKTFSLKGKRLITRQLDGSLLVTGEYDKSGKPIYERRANSTERLILKSALCKTDVVGSICFDGRSVDCPDTVQAPFTAPFTDEQREQTTEHEESPA